MTKAEFMAERDAAGAYNGIYCENETCCPCCNEAAELIENDWEDGELRCWYECSKCNLGWQVCYSLHYEESYGFIDLDD